MKKTKFLMPAIVIVGAIGILAALPARTVDMLGHETPASIKVATALNPNNYPKLAACATIPLDDPAAEAARNIAKGDRRPFTVYGFTPDKVHGIFCPTGNYSMDSRGGTFVSDMPDACGGMSFSSAPADKMLAYNRVLGADPDFQKITGCRPSTYCEDTYRKGYSPTTARDPRCPAEPETLARVAENDSVAALVDALRDFTDRSPRSRDAKTNAFVAALGRAKWENAEALLGAGADVNGRAFDSYPDKRRWLGSPLVAVFNQNGDIANQLPRARWLFAHGADFSHPGAQQALTWATFGNRVDAVTYLLAKGASPNGRNSKEAIDRCAQATIQSASSACGETPFYTALQQAQLLYARDNAAAIAHADDQHRRARINAIALYRAGARFFAGIGYDNLRGKPDLKVVSILLAAAEREGRTKDVIDRMLEAAKRSRDPGDQLALIAYLNTVAACPAIRPIPMDDYMKLCAAGTTL